MRPYVHESACGNQITSHKIKYPGIRIAGVRRISITYPIGNRAAHAGNQRNASSVTETNHLLSNCLRGHHDTRDVDFEHPVGVLGCVLKGRGFLLDSSSGN